MSELLKIKMMKQGGKILGNIVAQAFNNTTAGMTTLQIEEKITDNIDMAGAKPSFTTVNHYLYSSCIGLNNEVVHCPPNPKKFIKVGDLLKIDTGLIWNGWHTDMAWTAQINSSGKPEYHSVFLKAGKLALADAIRQCCAGNHVGNISQTIHDRISSAGYCVIKQLTGHSIGQKLHEKPFIPGYLNQKIDQTPKLIAGMTLAIEVIYSQGSDKIVIENDGWTISTQDGKMSGLFEQTVAIMPEGPLILTPVPEGF